MKNVMPTVLTFYDKEVTMMISRKYGFSLMDSFKKFLASETYRMLSDIELEMWDYSEHYIFDMWEVEQVTGDPRNSIYIRGSK